MNSPEPIGNHVSLWGEGPIWHRDRLLYVDIEGHKVIAFNPSTQEEKIWNVGERVGTVVAREAGGIIFAGELGIYLLDEETGSISRLADPESDLRGNRFNDGKCDPAGRFWAGTMPLGERKPVASLYCMEADHTVTKKFSDVTVSNGIVWTKDTKTMYYIDTPRKNVLAFDFDVKTGAISNERIALDTTPFFGNPDGMTIDSEDRLWIAFCHGSAVRCFNSQTWKLEDEITLPCEEVTACAFGGEDLQDLYISTGLKKNETAPLAGRIFVVRPGATGVKAFTFAG
jgi:sugar lactone lactonase YvrE